MQGHAHPITLITNEIVRIFTNIGFDVVDGPELDSEWYNFDALNVPRDHPSRDMQDTFWIKEDTLEKRPLTESEKKVVDSGLPLGHVLRTHTSTLQIRTMENWVREGREFPLAIVAPGKVFRNEATDARHEAQFHQIEGLLVGENITLANLRGTLEHFFSELYKRPIEIRFRSSFFPFVEPGVEVDMKWKGKWLEMMGAGLVHPNVLRSAGIDPNIWQGFAFGGGIDRFVAVKYGLTDIRELYTGDLRLIDQF